MFKNLAKAMGEKRGRMQPFDYIIFHNDVVTRDGALFPAVFP